MMDIEDEQEKQDFL